MAALEQQAHDLREALVLLALWRGRWQGVVAGTPARMVDRTNRLLATHGVSIDREPAR